MPTTKKRLNITLTPDMDTMLKAMSKRDRVPQATSAVALLAHALEVEEDMIWAEMAARRDTPGVKYLSHKEVWGKTI